MHLFSLRVLVNTTGVCLPGISSTRVAFQKLCTAVADSMALFVQRDMLLLVLLREYLIEPYAHRVVFFFKKCPCCR
jgi:hypothetical protein